MALETSAVAEATMSKAEFAELIRVSPSRISQYLSGGILDDAALVGSGRSARIRVNVAIEQIRARREPSQATGLNGMRTQLRAIAETFSPKAHEFGQMSTARALVDRETAKPQSPIWREGDGEATQAALDHVDALFRELYHEVRTMLEAAYLQCSDAEIETLVSGVFEMKMLEQARRWGLE